MTSYTSLSDLSAWQKARELRLSIARVAKSFPSYERYRLSDQIIRSSRSIPANIAEGFGRYHFKENAQYCRQARGSLIETQEHLVCAFDEGYIDQKMLNEEMGNTKKCLKVLNGYISYLSKRAK